jgi:hypothetical protein
VTTSRATKARTTTAATSAADEDPAIRQHLVVLSCVAAVAFAHPVAAGASDATLRTTLATWSQRIAGDAQGIGLSASNRHPRRMTRRARHFRADALRAVHAVSFVPATSDRGRRAKRLGVRAFRDYAVVGREWALSGQARIQGRKLIAAAHARLASRYATAANRLLLTAHRLLR